MNNSEKLAAIVDLERKLLTIIEEYINGIKSNMPEDQIQAIDKLLHKLQEELYELKINPN